MTCNHLAVVMERVPVIHLGRVSKIGRTVV